VRNTRSYSVGMYILGEGTENKCNFWLMNWHKICNSILVIKIMKVWWDLKLELARIKIFHRK
jgi:hypothetical protein